MPDIIDNRHLDFVGTKAHGDLIDTFVTLDIAEAFLNDPYDWEGDREPIVASTEAKIRYKFGTRGRLSADGQGQLTHRTRTDRKTGNSPRG
jgi:hypothetical protein